MKRALEFEFWAGALIVPLVLVFIGGLWALHTYALWQAYEWVAVANYGAPPVTFWHVAVFLMMTYYATSSGRWKEESGGWRTALILAVRPLVLLLLAYLVK